MPPRYVYWTIIAGGLPTAFRAVKQEDLLPTFARIKGKHPDAEMKWFARGKLWNSEEESRAPRGPGNWRESRDPRTAHGPAVRPGSVEGRPGVPPRGPQDRPVAPARTPAGDAPERRGRAWRPGGEHRDPRQPFKDAKKAKNQDRRQQRWDRKQRDPKASSAPPSEEKPPAPLRWGAPYKPVYSPKASPARPFRPRTSGSAPPRPPGRGGRGRP